MEKRFYITLSVTCNVWDNAKRWYAHNQDYAVVASFPDTYSGLMNSTRR